MWKILIIAVLVWVIIGAVRKSRHQYPAFDWRVLVGIGIGWTALRILLGIIAISAALWLFSLRVLMEIFF